MAQATVKITEVPVTNHEFLRNAMVIEISNQGVVFNDGGIYEPQCLVIAESQEMAFEAFTKVTGIPHELLAYDYGSYFVTKRLENNPYDGGGLILMNHPGVDALIATSNILSTAIYMTPEDVLKMQEFAIQIWE